MLKSFNLLNNEHDNLKKNFESLKHEHLQNSLKPSTCDIHCQTPIVKVDVSTSCDLTSCNENVIVETCDDNLAREHEELKKEVERLRKDLTRIKGKGTQEQAQPSQDNTIKGVTKLEKGFTVVCFKCHKEGHKSYQCKEEKIHHKNLNKGKSKKDYKNHKKNNQEKSPYLKASLVYTKPTHKAKKKRDHYILKKKNNGKVVAHIIGWRH